MLDVLASTWVVTDTEMNGLQKLSHKKRFKGLNNNITQNTCDGEQCLSLFCYLLRVIFFI